MRRRSDWNGPAGTVLFLDEIHRFTKPQQDVLLADVVARDLTLVGATTENPLFAVNSALVSRSTLFWLGRSRRMTLSASFGASADPKLRVRIAPRRSTRKPECGPPSATAMPAGL